MTTSFLFQDVHIDNLKGVNVCIVKRTCVWTTDMCMPTGGQQYTSYGYMENMLKAWSGVHSLKSLR